MAAPNGHFEHREAKLCTVTGGRGFLARHLVAALLRSGEWHVRITDLSPTVSLDPGEDQGLLGAALRAGRAVYMPADVCDLVELIQAFQEVDVVFHTAAANHAGSNLQLHHKINVAGTNKVIQACNACKVKRLIYTSSSSVVFDGVHGLFDVDESMPYPDKFPDPYAQTKAEAEKLVMRANGINELLTCCIRPGSIFGPGDNHLVPNLVSYGGMKAYFITNMQPMNMWEFVHMLSEELGYKSQFKIRIPSDLLMPIICVADWCYNRQLSLNGSPLLVLTSAKVKYVTLNRTFNCNKAVEDLDYKPVVSLEEGVKMTAEFYNHFRA